MDLVDKTEISKNLQETIHLIEKAGSFALHIVDDLLTYSKMNTPDFRILSEVFEVSQIINF